MIKLQFEIDLDLLDYDVDDVKNYFSEAAKIVNLIEEESENGIFSFCGRGLNTDLSYIAIMVDALVLNDWFKTCCKKMLLLSDSGSKDGSFYVIGDWIKSLKKFNRW